MIVQSSQSSRVLVVRVGRGEALQESLVALMKEQGARAATVLSAHGALESVTFDSYDPRGRSFGDVRTFGGAIELLSLTGHLMLQGASEVDSFVHITVARDTGNGVELVGGRLIEAPVLAVELTLMVHDDLALERVPDAATGIPSFRSVSAGGAANARESREAAKETARESARESARPAVTVTTVKPVVIPAAPKMPLVEVARALETMPARREAAPEVDEPEQPEVRAGDLLLHPTFDACEVIREAEPGTLEIRVQKNSSFRRIRMEVFEVTPREPRDGQRVWSLKPRKG